MRKIGLIGVNEYNLSDVEVVIIKRDRITGAVLQFRFPNVDNVSISTDVSQPERWDDGWITYTCPAVVEAMKFNGIALRDEKEGLIMEVREVVSAKLKRKRNR